MDPAAIRKKAVEQHLITAEEANRLTEPETLELVFRPGFSTAEQVTEISGRGVGLDVVQTVIQRLKGTVSIDSTPGGGTTFQLKVPLTLAIIKALLLRIGQRLCAIPLNAVVEIARVHESEIHNVDSHEVLQLRNAVLTLIRLGRKPHLQLSELRQKLFVVVISLGERKYGLIVDSLVGEEELVIKPLDDHVITTDLVSGASILGDGTVVLILNLPAVVEHYAKRDLPQFMPQDPIVATSVSSGTELDGGVR
jgi:two-component system chemotaxis sensor kinase CheA